MITKKLFLSAAITGLSFAATYAGQGEVSHLYPFAFPTAQDAFNDTYVVPHDARVVRALGHYQYEDMGTVEEIHRNNRRLEIAHENAVACSALLLLINGNCAEYDKFQELVAKHGTTDLSNICPEFAKQKEAEEARKKMLGEDGAGQQDLSLLEKKIEEAADLSKEAPAGLATEGNKAQDNSVGASTQE